MANDNDSKNFALNEACEYRLFQFIKNRDESFYASGIMKLWPKPEHSSYAK